MKKKLNIAFAGWGTGWHVTPISSLIEYANSKQEIMDQVKGLFRFGSKGQLEERFANNFPWVTFVPIKSGKLRRYRTVRSTLENLRDAAYFNAGYVQSLYLLKQHNIDVLFCKGWYVALPVSFAAATLRIPVIVHESDSHSWLVNKIVSKFSKKNFDGFPWTLKDSIHIGQILSPRLLHPDQDLDIFTGNKGRQNLLVICGSQGSEAIFQALLRDLDTAWHSVKNLNIFVILWLLNTKYKKQFEQHLNVQTFDFLDISKLAKLYEISDIVISRGSATTLAELEYFQIPKIIVPLPSHDQPHNARHYRDAYWDIVVDQSNLNELWNVIQYHLDQLRKKGVSKNKDIFFAHQEIWRSFFSINKKPI